MINYSTSISHPSSSSHTHHQQQHVQTKQQQQQVHVSKLQSALDDADVDQLIQFSTHKLAYHNRHFRQRIYALLLSHQFPHVSSMMHHHDSNDEHFPSTLVMTNNSSNNSNNGDGDDGGQYHHEYVDQVDKDVIRSLYKFVPDESDRTIKRQQLSHLVNSILSHPIAQYNNDSDVSDDGDENENDNDDDDDDDTKQITTMTPHYYQGFHELCSVLMLSVGPSMTLELMNRYLMPMRTYLNLHVNNSTLESVLNQLQSIYSILYSVGEKEYAHYLKKCDLDQGHYALSWVLTWYSHVIDDLSVAEKVMDAVIAHGSIFCIYMAVSIVIYRKQEVLYRKRDDDDTVTDDDDDDNDDNSDQDNQSEDEDDQDVSNKQQKKKKKRKEVSRPDFAQVFALLNRIPQEWCYEQYVPPSTQSTNRRINDNNEQETMTVWEYIIQQALKIKELMQTIPLIGEEELRELEREEMEQERRLRRIQQQRSQSPALKHGSSSSWVMWATVFLTVGVSTGLFLLQQQASNLL